VLLADRGRHGRVVLPVPPSTRRQARQPRIQLVISPPVGRPRNAAARAMREPSGMAARSSVNAGQIAVGRVHLRLQVSRLLLVCSRVAPVSASRDGESARPIVLRAASRPIGESVLSFQSGVGRPTCRAASSDETASPVHLAQQSTVARSPGFERLPVILFFLFCLALEVDQDPPNWRCEWSAGDV